jgi:hypothetical protein
MRQWSRSKSLHTWSTSFHRVKTAASSSARLIEILEDRCTPAFSGIGSEFLLNQFTTNEQGFTASAMDSNGNFVVVWESVNQAGGSSGRDIYGRLYDAQGAALGNEFLVNSYTTSDQSKARVAMAASGSFVVTWQSQGQDGEGSGVYMQRFNASGVKQGGETLVNSGQTADEQQVPDIGMDSAGNFIIVWQSGDINDYTAGDGDFLTPGLIGVYAQRYTSAGAANGGRFRVNQDVTGPQALPSVAVNASGSFVITFSSIPDLDNTNDVRILARRGTLSGGISGNEFQVDQGGSTEQFGSDVAIDANGNFVIAWSSTQDESGLNPRRNNVYARRYNSAGTAQGSNFRVNAYLTGDQLQPQVAMDAAGNFVIVFQSGLKPESNPAPADQPDGSLYGVYARRYNSAGAADSSTEYRINETTVGSQFFPAITMNSSTGDFILSWSSGSNQDGNNYGNYAKRFVASNASPLANAGGPYTINEGSSLALNASAGSDPEGQAMTYSWDVNGDGIYGDAFGANPVLTWGQLNALGILDGPDARTVRVQVVDAFGGEAISPGVALTVQAVAPTVQINGWNYLVRGQSRDYYFTASDPSSGDQQANMTYKIDWDGNGTVDETIIGSGFGVNTSHSYAASGSYTLRVTATDRDGMESSVTTLPVTVVNWALLADSNDNSKTDLHWGGTNGIDAYGFLPGGFVLIQAQNNQFFPNPQIVVTGSYNGKLYVYGQGSNDLLFADVMTQSLVFLGGDGDDVLVGGRAGDRLEGGNGNDILLGGTLSTDGNDTIFGGAGNDLIVGHYGADLLSGDAGQDLLIAGSLFFDNLPNAVYAMQAEWLSGRPYADRVANISGTGVGPRNNGNFFLTPTVTALDDGAVDQVLGGSDQDWLLADLQTDVVSDLTVDETATDLI